MSRRASVIVLVSIVILIVGASFLAINGVSIGRYDVLPIQEGVRLGLDLRGGVYTVYEASEEGVEDFGAQMGNTMTVLRRRLDAQGYTEATVTQQGSNRIRVEIPNVDNPNDVLSIIGTPAKLEFTEPNGTVVIQGKDVVKATAVSTVEEGPVVNLELTSEGAAAFAEATSRLVGQSITIKLDGEQISAPIVQTAITDGKCMINKISTMAEAQNLAVLIESGALPLDLEQLEVRTQSATLGADALSKSLLAGAIGIGILFVFMIIIYRGLGVIADIALSIYMLLVAFLLAVIPSVQLTLPGIAGIVLGVGMAVDANVIIFERIKEELRAGKTLRSCLNTSFSKALTAIIDANVTTLIAACVLLYFGTGPIKGYAITLTIGIVVAVITSVVISRALLKLLVGLGLKSNRWYMPARKEKEAK
jgi:preprotein translocase subunit SecD